MTAAKGFWMPFHGDDFYMDSDVRMMTYEQQGAYVALLWAAWRDHGIPKDPDDLRDLLRVGEDEFRRIWHRVGRLWHDHPDDPRKLLNPRMEKERGHADKVRRQREEASKKGGAATRAALQGGPDG